MEREEKLKALDAAITQIEKAYGKGSVMKLGDSGAHMNIETVPTGSLSLDIALGLGGVPKGRIVEIYGPESSGKTTVALHMVAEVQKRGGIAGFIDAVNGSEHTKAKKGIENANTKIIKQISQLQSEIERLRSKIGMCNSNVNSFNRQKSNYIAAKEAAEREAAAKAASSMDSTKK